MSDENKLTDISGGISFDTQKFAFGQRIGLKIDSSKTTAIEKAIDALTTVDGDLLSILDTLFGSEDPSKAVFGYDPNAKWLAGMAITYGVLTLDVLLVDGQFYGLVIKIGKKPKPKPKSLAGDVQTAANDAALFGDDNNNDNDDDNGEGDDQPFAGLKLELIYRKINDHLGEFSADLTLPKKYREFKMGAGSVTLPAVALSVWTNGDFSVSIGWPLGDRSFNISFPPNPIPWAGGGGLYFARLRSEDNPGKLGVGFNPIIQFGIGLRIGAATEGNWGILKYGASIYLFGTFQGFLAWDENHSFSDGLDYYWFCATVGITGHLEGEVNFVVIKVSVALDVTASVALAIETGHAAYAVAKFTASVEAKIKILFITIHFSFKLEVQVDITIGSGPAAKITGPTPPTSSMLLAEPPVPAVAALAGEIYVDQAVAGMGITQTARTDRIVQTVTPIAIGLSFLLQPTIRFDIPNRKWVPVGVASLVIGRTAPAGGAGSANLGLGTDSFSLLIESLAGYILQTYGGYTDPAAVVTATNLAALDTALETNQFTLSSVYSWLNNSGVEFTVTGGSTGPSDGALFPMVPGLTLTYNAQPTAFGDGTPPENYLTVLENYFAELSIIGDGSIDSARLAALFETAPVSSADWMPGVIFGDYFNILAKQISKEIAQLDTPGTLAADLAAIDIGNMAGIVTRFLQHGLRLPDPADLSAPIQSMDTLPLFDLTGQQFDVAYVDSQPVMSAALSGKSSVSVSIAGDGSAPLPFVLDQAPAASPLWSPQELARINNVQSSFMLQQGVPWTSASAGWQLFAFPDTLQSQLRLMNNLSLTLSATDGQTAPVAASGQGALMIRFSLAQVPDPSGKGYLKSIFQVTGTDEGTRDLMELLFASGTMGDVAVDLLLPAGKPNSGAGYTTSAADASSIIFKTNLSTDNEPNAAMLLTAMKGFAADNNLPPLGATWASISKPADFLLLLWECSIVHNGGFYISIPDVDFGAAQQLDVAAVVKSTGAPAPQAAVTNYQNTILVSSAGLSAGDRVQAAVFESDGMTPVTEPKPAYPAGTIAFGAEWNNAPAAVTGGDSAAYATVLYQMLEFQIAPGAGISKGSGWSMPLGPNTDPGTGVDTWSYARAVPVYRFVDNAAVVPNRYGAIGLPVNLNLQLVDIFGNAFGLNALPSMAVYNDPLIPVDEWPGASILYTYSQGTGGQAVLGLTVSFEADQVTEKETALAYYQIIFDQLTDARTSLAVTSSMAAGAINVSTTSGAALQASLVTFLRGVIAYLAPKSTAQPPADLTLSGNVPIDYVTRIGEDLFPLWVSLTATRSAPAENSAYSYPDGFLSVVSQLPPLLDPAPPPALGDDPPGPTVDDEATALRDWSIGFEQAFNNFDGASGLLKVLIGAPPAKVVATRSLLGATAAGAVTSAPGDLWAMKWGAASGVSVEFGNAAGETGAQPVYFAPLPLSTELISADVEIDTYDNGGNKLTSVKQTFSGIDMDGYGKSFLQAVDALLSPDIASAITQIDGSQYDALMGAKEELAYAISSGISWVFQDQMPVNGNPGMGDLDSAQKRFRENLLASLASDFTTSVIVQVPATVTVKNQFEAGAGSRPPDFFGSPSPVSDTVSATTLNQYTISNTALPVTDGVGHLNFLVGAIDPTIKSDLLLNFAYDINFLDHQFETSAEQFGYTPSSWLRFVVPDVDPAGGGPVLDVSMGQLDIPIPLRAYPSPPRLIDQSAAYPENAPAPATIAEAIAFSYNLTIARPQVAQDDLHMAIEFNGAVVNPNLSADAGNALFAALANFQSFQSQYLPNATQAILAKSSTAAQWLKDIVALVKSVADAWQGAGTMPQAESFAGDQPIPAPFIWDFMLQVPDETTPNVMLLTWTDSDAPASSSWPLINGVAGQAHTASAPYNYTMQYTLPAEDPNLDQPTLSWPGLSVITTQSVSAEAWIERNETLAGGGGATNPAFVYSTSKVKFPSPAIPLLTAPGLITINAASVNDAVNQLVTQIMQPTSPVSQVGLGIQADYSFVLVAGNTDQQLQTRLPVFLVKTGVSTETDPTPPVETSQQLISALQNALISWYGDFQPSTTNASLLFEVTIFAANSQQPMALLLDIESPISGAGWWTPA